MNPCDRDEVIYRRDQAQSRLLNLEKQDEEIGKLVGQSESLMIGIEGILGRVSQEYCQARTTFLLLADTRCNIIIGIHRTRVNLQALEESLTES